MPRNGPDEEIPQRTNLGKNDHSNHATGSKHKYECNEVSSTSQSEAPGVSSLLFLQETIWGLRIGSKLPFLCGL